MGFLGRKNLLGQQAMVFCARGLYSFWKIPLGYFISHSAINHNNLKNIIVKCIEKLSKFGFIVRAKVCDQGTNNRAAYKDLGMNSEKPYFFIDDKKIFGIYDIPHIFKSRRNDWLTGDYIYKDKIVSFSDVKAVYDIDKKSTTSRCLLKITDAHMNPNAFQKMNCKLALQIFSHSLSSAMKTNVQTGQ